MSIAVIGAGKWGQAIKFALSFKNDVVITSRKERKIKDFVSLQTALDKKHLIIVISAQQINEWLEKNFKYKKDQKILVASKGIDTKSKKFLNEIFERYVPPQNLSFLTGPSFAAEVMKALPTAVVINSVSKNTAEEFASFFPKFIKTYISDDVIGAEICGAYKNIIAIASGICDGLELGNNARASLIARGLVEMQRFGKYFGAKEETFLGLSGAGDLFLTASSKLSRNYRVGFSLAKDKKLNDILHELGEVAEGVYTVNAVYAIAQKYSVYIPIATEVWHILQGKKPQKSLETLLEN
jgi:glycerol-3-phosphate dehydrogenase (NAD(P)+)